MTCDGQLLPISEYDTLFNLIGTTYGGDGQSTFALPNLSGRLPVHAGTGSTGTSYQIGELAGVSSVTLTTQQIPNHNHAVIADNSAPNSNQVLPTNNFYGTQPPAKIYSTKQSGLNPMFNLPLQGGSQPHDNMMPYLAVTFIISLFGIFPSPT
jgi:microcystin-dependent protein